MSRDLTDWNERFEYARECERRGPMKPTADHLTLLADSEWSWDTIGIHDVSRLVNLLDGGSSNTEQRRLGESIVRQVKRHNAGRLALRMLRDHGGPDFTDDETSTAAAP